jgi:hypothetical protein
VSSARKVKRALYQLHRQAVHPLRQARTGRKVKRSLDDLHQQATETLRWARSNDVSDEQLLQLADEQGVKWVYEALLREERA